MSIAVGKAEPPDPVKVAANTADESPNDYLSAESMALVLIDLSDPVVEAEEVAHLAA